MFDRIDRIPVNKYFSRRVVLLREAANISRASLADTLKIHPITLMRIELYKEGEELSVSNNTLRLIADHFNISEDWIKSDIDDLQTELTKELMLKVKVRTPLIKSLEYANIDKLLIPRLADNITNLFILLGKT